jgi:hypothetical protein
LTESVERLEKMSSLEKSPMQFMEISRKKSQIRGDKSEESTRIKKGKTLMEPMENAFCSRRVNMKMWTPELLDALDECFVNKFMLNGEPVDWLFTNSAKYINEYEEYSRAVDDVLIGHPKSKFTNAREYFKYTTIYELHDLDFPLPIGTRSVVECLNKILTARAKGMTEVSDVRVFVLLSRCCLVMFHCRE